MKEASSALEDFLIQAGKQGALEGEHVFRVDTVGALSRLSDFRLPSPHHWVVKIVQWANAIEAESVTFKLRRRESEVFVSGLPPSTASQVLRDMTKVTTLSDHLVTALLSLAREDTPSFELEIFREQEHEAYRYEHSERRLSALAARSLSQNGLRLKVRGGVIKLLRSDRAALHKLLYQVCWSSPVPVEVDGRQPELRYAKTHEMTYRKSLYALSFSLAWAAIPVLAQRPVLKLRVPTTEGLEALPRRRGFGQGYARQNVPAGEMFLHYQPDYPMGAVLNIKSSVTSSVVFCCDGVEVDRVLLQEPIVRYGNPEFFTKMGFEIYIAVSGSETDLSGFKVRRGEELSALVLATAMSDLVRLWDLFLVCPESFFSRLLKPEQQRFLDNPMALLFGTTAAVASGVALGGVLPGLAVGAPVAAMTGKGIDIWFWYHRLILKTSVGSMSRLLGFRECLLELEAQQRSPGFEVGEPEVTDWSKGWAAWSSVGSNRSWVLELLLAVREISSQREPVHFQFGRTGIVVEVSLSDPDLPGPLELLKSFPSLGRALRDLVLLEPSQVSLRVGASKAEWTEGEGREFGAAEEGPMFRLEARFPTRSTKGGFLDGLKDRFSRQTLWYAEDITTLQECGWLSPVRLDGRLLDSREAHFPRKLREVCYDAASVDLPICLGRRDLPVEADSPWFQCPVDRRDATAIPQGWYKEKKLTLPDTFLYWGEAEPTVGGMIVLTGSQRAQSALEFVYQGVVVGVLPLFPADTFRTSMGVKEIALYQPLRKMLKTPVALRCFVPVAQVPELQERGPIAREFLQKYRQEILELSELVSKHLPSLSYRWSKEMFQSKKAHVQAYNLQSSLHKTLSVRRKNTAEALEGTAEFLDEQISRLGNLGVYSHLSGE